MLCRLRAARYIPPSLSRRTSTLVATIRSAQPSTIAFVLLLYSVAIHNPVRYPSISPPCGGHSYHLPVRPTRQPSLLSPLQPSVTFKSAVLEAIATFAPAQSISFCLLSGQPTNEPSLQFIKSPLEQPLSHQSSPQPSLLSIKSHPPVKPLRINHVRRHLRHRVFDPVRCPWQSRPDLLSRSHPEDRRFGHHQTHDRTSSYPNVTDHNKCISQCSSLFLDCHHVPSPPRRPLSIPHLVPAVSIPGSSQPSTQPVQIVDNPSLAAF
jgi:hypothetical protein